jgi:transposase
MTIAITRLALSAVDLRAAARRTRDAKVARRMIAIALVLEGWPREAAAEDGAMDRELCDWVHRYNELGLDGLFDRPSRNGPPPRLSAEQQALVAEWVEQRPEFAGRCGALALCRSAAAIVQEFAVQLQRAHVGKLLRTLVFRRLSVRPQHPDASNGPICSVQSVQSAVLVPLLLCRRSMSRR